MKDPIQELKDNWQDHWKWLLNINEEAICMSEGNVANYLLAHKPLPGTLIAKVYQQPGWQLVADLVDGKHGLLVTNHFDKLHGGYLNHNARTVRLVWKNPMQIGSTKIICDYEYIAS